MRKKILTTLTLFSLGLFLLGIISIIGLSLFLTAQHCTTLKCSSLPEWNLGYLILVAAGVLHMIAWIGTLIKQMQWRQWAWFVCTLLFSPISLWIYLITIPEASEPIVPVYMQPEQPVYQPYVQGYGASQPVNAQPRTFEERGQQPPYLAQHEQQQQHEDLMTMYPQE